MKKLLLCGFLSIVCADPSYAAFDIKKGLGSVISKVGSTPVGSKVTGFLQNTSTGKTLTAVGKAIGNAAVQVGQQGLVQQSSTIVAQAQNTATSTYSQVGSLKTQMASSLGGLASGITNGQARSAAINASNTTATIDTLNANIDALNTNIANISAELSSITAQLNRINSGTATAADISSLPQLQTRQIQLGSQLGTYQTQLATYKSQLNTALANQNVYLQTLQGVSQGTTDAVQRTVLNNYTNYASQVSNMQRGLSALSTVKASLSQLYANCKNGVYKNPAELKTAFVSSGVTEAANEARQSLSNTGAASLGTQLVTSVSNLNNLDNILATGIASATGGITGTSTTNFGVGASTTGVAVPMASPTLIQNPAQLSVVPMSTIPTTTPLSVVPVSVTPVTTPAVQRRY